MSNYNSIKSILKEESSQDKAIIRIAEVLDELEVRINQLDNLVTNYMGEKN